MGSISGGMLEMPNVDLSQEFAHLNVARRGFRANARIITTSEEVAKGSGQPQAVSHLHTSEPPDRRGGFGGSVLSAGFRRNYTLLVLLLLKSVSCARELRRRRVAG